MDLSELAVIIVLLIADQKLQFLPSSHSVPP